MNFWAALFTGLHLAIPLPQGKNIVPIITRSAKKFKVPVSTTILPTSSCKTFSACSRQLQAAVSAFQSRNQTEQLKALLSFEKLAECSSCHDVIENTLINFYGHDNYEIHGATLDVCAVLALYKKNSLIGWQATHEALDKRSNYYAQDPLVRVKALNVLRSFIIQGYSTPHGLFGAQYVVSRLEDAVADASTEVQEQALNIFELLVFFTNDYYEQALQAALFVLETTKNDDCVCAAFSLLICLALRDLVDEEAVSEVLARYNESDDEDIQEAVQLLARACAVNSADAW